MLAAEWDLVELLMVSMSESYPEHFSLTRNGDDWHWINRPMGIDQKFIFGDVSTLPYRPMEYITRQCQGDFCLLDQRDGDLWMDAGIVSSQADWSLDFDVGMSFKEWQAHRADGARDRDFRPCTRNSCSTCSRARPVRRLNWTMTINPRLDTSPENYHKWGPDRTTVTPENVGDKVHLRVELQGLWRLPRSNAIVFSIRGYLLKMRELVTVPKWGRRMPRVLKTLPPEIAAYKGLTRYQQDDDRLAVEIRRRRTDVCRASSRIETPSPRHSSLVKTERNRNRACLRELPSLAPGRAVWQF